jgi:taurine--2-oxoglutarate transaminase
MTMTLPPAGDAGATAGTIAFADLLPDATHTYDLDRAHVFHSWSAQAARHPMVITRAEGCRVWDGAGRRYLDLSSQLVNTNIGHQHPRVVAAIREQAARLCTVAPQHANDARSEAARLVAEVVAGADLDRVFFTNGGADAVEHAVRMARLHTGRPKVLSAYRSYHGGTQTAITLTGDPRRWPNDSGTAGVVHFFGPFLYRSAFYSRTQEEECERALAHLEQVIAFEGPGTIAAVVLESVPGTAGIMPPPRGYLAGVRELCDRHGILWIADEVMCGFGRTGRWFGYAEPDGSAPAVPDLVTVAKGITSGYVPLGAVVLARDVADTFADRPYPGGLTYSGHPLACAAAVATIRTMQDERIVENAHRVGRERLGPGLRALADRHPSVGDVRGSGVFWCLELVRDRSTKEPLAPYGGSSPAMAEVLAALKTAGVLPFANFHRIHVVPPCTIADADADEALAALDAALDVADRHCR